MRSGEQDRLAVDLPEADPPVPCAPPHPARRRRRHLQHLHALPLLQKPAGDRESPRVSLAGQAHHGRAGVHPAAGRSDGLVCLLEPSALKRLLHHEHRVWARLAQRRRRVALQPGRRARLEVLLPEGPQLLRVRFAVAGTTARAASPRPTPTASAPSSSRVNS